MPVDMNAVRKSSAGLKLGKLLFSKNVLSLSPYTIASLLKAAGVPVPTDKPIDATVAQMLFAGGGYSKNVEIAADMYSLAFGGENPEVYIDLFKTLGWLNLSKDQMQELQIGEDVVSVFASLGSNVQADLKLVTDVSSIVADWQGQAQREAQAGLAGVLRQRKQYELSNSAMLFKLYQSGQRSIFETMMGVAGVAPDYFLTYFPQLQGFIPTYSLNFSYHESDTSWWGDHNSYDANTAIQTIQNDLRTMQLGIFGKYVGTPLTGFNSIFVASQNAASSFYEERSLVNPTQADNLRKFGFPKGSGLPVHNFPLPRIRLDDLAALSMIPPYIQVFPTGFDIGRLLEFLNLTPYDLEDPIIDIAVQNPELFPQAPKMNLTPKFTMNGVDYYSPDQEKTYAGEIAKAKIDSQLQKNLQNWDIDGDIHSIRRTPKGKYILKEWGTLPVAGADQVGVENWWTKFGMTYDPYKAVDISQYWSALGFLDKIKGDNVFSSDLSRSLTGQTFDDIFGKYNWTGQIKAIETKHKRLWSKVVLRKINLNALNNVAHFLGTTRQKLKRVVTGNGTVYYES